VAPTARCPANGVAAGDAPRGDEADLGQLSRQLAVALPVVRKSLELSVGPLGNAATPRTARSWPTTILPRNTRPSSPIVAGWNYQWICQLDWAPDSRGRPWSMCCASRPHSAW